MIRVMWRDDDEDIKAQLLLSVSGNTKQPEFSCDIFLTFHSLASDDDDDQAMLFSNRTTLKHLVH